MILEMDAADLPTLSSWARLRKWLMIVPVMVAAVLAVQRAASEDNAAGSTSLVGVTDKAHAPIALPSLDGPRHELAQFRGRVVLVHFFATWCEPCRAEMASLKELQARLAGRPLAIVPISVAEADGAVRRFFADDPLPFPILLDRDRAVAKAWSIHTLPSTVVLDRDLQPRFIAEGDVDWTRPQVMDTLVALLQEVPR
jgi:thiol-disulfide isomerase/thioredoxin